MDDIVHCEECGMNYIASRADDRRKHDKVHHEAQVSYAQTLAVPKKVWSRPSIENAGVYRALNEMNPNLNGFQFYGLSDNQVADITNGIVLLPVGISNGGDGHDRHGQWGSYIFQANWRGGMVNFTLIRTDQTTDL